jgi:hypothetical protein
MGVALVNQSGGDLEQTTEHPNVITTDQEAEGLFFSFRSSRAGLLVHCRNAMPPRVTSCIDGDIKRTSITT